MALTVAELEAARDALKRALAKGERQVTFADRSVTYRSVEEILHALQAIEADLANAAGRPRQWAVHTSKGLSK